MKVFKVWVDKCSYDEYDSCIVVAKNADAVRAMMKRKDYSDACVGLGDKVYFYVSQGRIHIEEVDLTKSGVICASFHAG